MSSHLNIHLLIIDPQKDFCEGGALPVIGANADMERLAAFVNKHGRKLEDVHVTLDSHHIVDIAHPAWFVNSNGEHPNPGTVITHADMESGVWNTRIPGARERTLRYLKDLESRGRFSHMIWPPHCLIGTTGATVHDSLNTALQGWASTNVATVDYRTKGSNPFTEHFGGLEAEVPDPSDPSTMIDMSPTGLIATLQNADIILVAGEASSHCVKTTVEQIADNIGDEHLKKFHLMTDCMSPVVIPGVVDFTPVADEFTRNMLARGMKVTTSDKFFN